MDLSIIIVNWRSKDYLKKCLLSIANAPLEISPQILVIDAGSFDGCGEMLEAEFPEIEFIQSEKNIGFGRTNNLGFTNITGDALLLLNPDTEVLGNSLDILLNQLSTLPNAGILGAQLLNSDGSLQTTCVRSLPTPLNRALKCGALQAITLRYGISSKAKAFSSKDPIEVEAVSGACMMMRSKTFRAAGGFSEEFFMYGEDLDLCSKVKRLGLNNCYVPGAKVIHHGGASSKSQFSKFSTVLMCQAGLIFMRLNYGLLSAWSYRILQGATAMGRLLFLAPMALLEPLTEGLWVRYTFRKWITVLRWSVGMERWAEKCGKDLTG